MTYFLNRVSDNAGDSGPMSDGYYLDSQDQIKHESPARPRVGLFMRVGTPIARTFPGQDWWQTTKILEILEDSGDTVRFRTENSEYVWRKG